MNSVTYKIVVDDVGFMAVGRLLSLLPICSFSLASLLVLTPLHLLMLTNMLQPRCKLYLVCASLRLAD